MGFVCTDCTACFPEWDDEYEYCPECGAYSTVIEQDDLDEDDHVDTDEDETYSLSTGTKTMSTADDVDELFNRAKAAYRREISQEQERIQRDQKHAYDWVQSVIGFLTAIVNAFTAVWNSSCYITTAISRHFGLPDDCRQLMVLRSFRQTYILASNNESRLRDLAFYNKIAPQMVVLIGAQPDADAIWRKLAGHIADAVTAIDEGRYSEAYEIYKTQVLDLRRQFVDRGIQDEAGC